MDGLRRVALQGKNLNRLLRSPEVGNACAVWRKIPVELLSFAVEINSGKLRSAALQRIECGHNHLLAIFGPLVSLRLTPRTIRPAAIPGRSTLQAARIP